jgi:hypothetical protein
MPIRTRTPRGARCCRRLCPEKTLSKRIEDTESGRPAESRSEAAGRIKAAGRSEAAGRAHRVPGGPRAEVSALELHDLLYPVCVAPAFRRGIDKRIKHRLHRVHVIDTAAEGDRVHVVMFPGHPCGEGILR